MCGIVAVLSAYTNGFNYNEVKAFTDMLFVDTLRGFDSTGVFGVDNKGDVGILKAAINGADFVQTPEYKAFANEGFQRGAIMVGHNRAATRGSVSDANAHPFWVDDNIVLVQNGTWNGSHKHVKDTEVDTEAVAHVISEAESVEKALQKVDAAYALVWYNVKEKTLYAIRNMQRPLCIAYTKEGTVLIASEINTILFAASRQNLTLQEKPYEIASGELCAWTVTNKGLDFKSESIDHAYRGSSFRHGGTHWPYVGAEQGDFYDYKKHYSYPTTQTLTEPENTIRTTMHELVQRGSFPDFEMRKEDALKVIKDLDARPRDKEIVVEFIDYVAANYHRDCKVFYIVGKPVNVDPNDHTPLVYIVKDSIDENQAMDYAGKIFTAQISSYKGQEIFTNNKSLVTAFVHQLNEITDVTTTQ